MSVEMLYRTYLDERFGQVGDFDLLRMYLEEKFFNVDKFEVQLRHFQETAVEFLEHNPFSALFVDLGLGKTVTTLTLLSRLSWQWKFNKALIIAPLRVINQTWPTELMSWEHTAPMSFTLLRHKGNEPEISEVTSGFDWEDWREAFGKIGAKQQFNREITKAQARVRERLAFEDTQIHMISREQVEWLVNLHGGNWPYDVVIFDESSGLKDWKTARWKALKRVRPYIKRFHQLTATPAAETYLHLFPQIFLLDLGERLGRFITKFRNEYFTYNQYSRQYTIRPGAQEQISEKIADICLVMKAEDYLPMDEPIIVHRPITFEKSLHDQYKKFQDEFILELPDNEYIEAKNAAALCNKLLQFASGAIYDEEKKPRMVHDHKIEELRQIIEEAQGEPVLIAYWFQSSLDRLKKAFPDLVVMDKNGKCVPKWSAGKINKLAIHPASAGHGLNLQYGGHHLVFFELPWSLELYLQTIGRLARQGQSHVVKVFLLYAIGTLEEYVIQRLDEKDEAQEILFRWIKKVRDEMKRRLASGSQKTGTEGRREFVLAG